MIISIKESVLAYCNQCGQPKLCGIFKLFGWGHQFNICRICLAALNKWGADGEGERHE